MDSLCRFLPFKTKLDSKTGNDYVIKMSELNNSYSASIKELLMNSVNKSYHSNDSSILTRKDSEIFDLSRQLDSLTESLNEVDLKMFVEDLRLDDSSRDKSMRGGCLVDPENSDQPIDHDNSNQLINHEKFDQPINPEKFDQLINPEKCDQLINPDNSDLVINPDNSDQLINPKNSDQLINPENSNRLINPEKRITIEKRDKQYTIIDSRTNDDSEVDVVTVKILPFKKSSETVRKINILITRTDETDFKPVDAQQGKIQNASKNQKPLMGRNALMAKNKSSSQWQHRSDSEIIQELVTNRFSNFLNNYYKRSFKRMNSKVLKHTFEETDEGNDDHNSNDPFARTHDVLKKAFTDYYETSATCCSDNIFTQNDPHIFIKNVYMNTNQTEIPSTTVTKIQSNSGNHRESEDLEILNEDILSSTWNNSAIEDSSLSIKNNCSDKDITHRESRIEELRRNCETFFRNRSNYYQIDSSKHNTSYCETYKIVSSSEMVNEEAPMNVSFSSTGESTSKGSRMTSSTYTLPDLDAKKSSSLGDWTFSDLTINKTEVDLDFLLSTDGNNKESSAEVISPSSLESKEDSRMVSFDVHGFLKDALGEELKNYVSTDSQVISDLDYSENRSIDTSNISDLLSNASSFCSFAKSASKFTRKSTTIQEEHSGTQQNSSFEYYMTNKKLSEYILESNIQQQIILQTAKALSFCKRTKEFMSSIEEIEAERILLLASLKRDSLKEEIRRMENEDSNDGPRFGGGCVRIDGLTFPPKTKSSYDPSFFDKRRKEYSHWFVGVVKTGAVVFATKPSLPDEDGVVKFQERFVFENLSSDFQIIIALYVIRVRNNARNYSHESKYHLNKNINTLCPSPHRLFHLTRDNKRTKFSEYVTSSSSFSLEGRCSMGINNLTDLGYFKLTETPLSSSLEGIVAVNFSTTVNMPEEHFGFLNVGTSNGDHIIWNRRWCALKGAKLLYFNYPEEAVPLGYVDLRYCLTSYIMLAERRMCPRPRTLFLETVPAGKCGEFGNKPTHVNKHFLAADCVQSLRMWEAKLNSTLADLRNWNCMECYFKFPRQV